MSDKKIDAEIGIRIRLLLIVAVCIVGMIAYRNRPLIAVRAADGFRFPKVTEVTKGRYEVKISERQKKPELAYARRISNVKKSSSVERAMVSGDIARIHYQMVSWEDGKTVEGSREHSADGIEIVVGPPDESSSMRTAARVPEFLSQSVIGAAAGDKIMVVFPVNTPDLPEHLDKDDAYVLIVDILGGETAESYRERRIVENEKWFSAQIQRLKKEKGHSSD